MALPKALRGSQSEGSCGDQTLVFSTFLNERRIFKSFKIFCKSSQMMTKCQEPRSSKISNDRDGWSDFSAAASRKADGRHDRGLRHRIKLDKFLLNKKILICGPGKDLDDVEGRAKSWEIPR